MKRHFALLLLSTLPLISCTSIGQQISNNNGLLILTSQKPVQPTPLLPPLLSKSPMTPKKASTLGRQKTENLEIVFESSEVIASYVVLR